MNPAKTPKEAARLSEKRAREAKAKYSAQCGEPSLSSDDILSALNDNEIGDARLLLATMKDRFVFDPKRGSYFRFEDGFWKKDLENETLSVAGRILREAYGKETVRQYAIATDPKEDDEAKKAALYRQDQCNRRREKINTLHRQQSVLKLAATGRNGLIITGDEWNADPWAIQVGELLIDLKTGEARQGLPADYINKASPTKWTGLETPAEQWDAFMLSVFNGDSELVQYVQRTLGAALVGIPGQQEFYIFWGEGRNGKGTILETLKEILGEGLASPIRSEMIMDARQFGSNGPNPELLDLQGKRIVWASETREGQKLNAEKIKLFTGGDTLSSRYN